MPTHGSLTKAGKVRSQTPKIEPTPKTRPIPRRRNWANYNKKIVMASAQSERGEGRGERL